MFDDIVANTNPVLADIPSYEHNMYHTINDAVFNQKRTLRQNAPQFRAHASEYISDIDKNDIINLVADDDLDMISDFSQEADRQAMLDFFRLRPTDRAEHGGLF